MKIKDVIAQAEDRFNEQFLTDFDMEIIDWKDENPNPDEIKDFIFKSYTKDLLQSDREEIKAEIKNKIKGIGMSSANYREVLDIINNIQKENTENDETQEERYGKGLI